MDNVSGLTLPPGATLRAVAGQMDIGNIKTFYLFTVDHVGNVKNTIYIDPDRAEQHMKRLGAAAVELCERLDNTLNVSGAAR